MAEVSRLNSLFLFWFPKQSFRESNVVRVLYSQLHNWQILKKVDRKMIFTKHHWRLMRLSYGRGGTSVMIRLIRRA
jgi:hypothetical protein